MPDPMPLKCLKRFNIYQTILSLSFYISLNFILSLRQGVWDSQWEPQWLFALGDPGFQAGLQDGSLLSWPTVKLLLGTFQLSVHKVQDNVQLVVKSWRKLGYLSPGLYRKFSSTLLGSEGRLGKGRERTLRHVSFAKKSAYGWKIGP